MKIEKDIEKLEVSNRESNLILHLLLERLSGRADKKLALKKVSAVKN